MTDGPIIVFDAMCVLCSTNAQFVLRHDRHGHFRLASTQGEVGRDLCRRFGIDPENPDTIMLVEGDRAVRNSDAMLAIYAGLGWPWRGTAILRAVPRVVRDLVYRLVARNRYRLFGRHAICWLPASSYRERIL